MNIYRQSSLPQIDIIFKPEIWEGIASDLEIFSTSTSKINTSIQRGVYFILAQCPLNMVSSLLALDRWQENGRLVGTGKPRLVKHHAIYRTACTTWVSIRNWSIGCTPPVIRCLNGLL